VDDYSDQDAVSSPNSEFYAGKRNFTEFHSFESILSIYGVAQSLIVKGVSVIQDIEAIDYEVGQLPGYSWLIHWIQDEPLNILLKSTEKF
jgi:hypothetical protein